MDYSKIAPLLLEAIKEQQREIEAFKSETHKTGCDYAEYFESLDDKEISVGTSVVLEEDRIRPAENGETPIGVISTNPVLVGNTPAEWP